LVEKIRQTLPPPQKGVMNHDPTQTVRYQSFAEFYPHYLAEHQHPVDRTLHAVGTVLAVAALLGSLVVQEPWALLLVPLFGYGFAWIGHFLFENNRPTTFHNQYPIYSLLGDVVLVKDVLAGRASPNEKTE
jgi:hypothetical protein